MSKPKVEGRGNTPVLQPRTPIQIPVSIFEKEAYEEAGNATDDDIKSFVLLKLIARGAGAEQANQLADQIAEAALLVRRRIEAATRYELIVNEEPRSR